MRLVTSRIEQTTFQEERERVLGTWPTGRDVDLISAYTFHQELPDDRVCTCVLQDAVATGRTLLQPRAGVALTDEHIRLLHYLEAEADLLPTTIDAYTRQNRYTEAEAGIKRSQDAGRSLLNGYPAVNHGVAACRRIIEETIRPVEVRHGTPDARLLAEITLSAGFTSFEGGGISYNIPYAKRVPLERSIRDWQYVDRLVGIYEEHGCPIDREPFGPLSGTLVPPCISHSVAILEGLLALEQGVRSLSLGYGQAGNLIQDIAAMQTLRELASYYFQEAGYQDFTIATVFHQWMGGFPDNEARAYAVIGWGGVAASLAGATKVIVKTPHEAMGIPTREANLAGLQATRQSISMVMDHAPITSEALEEEKELIRQEVHAIMRSVFEAGMDRGGRVDLVEGIVRAFAAGIIDVPFAPSKVNLGKMLPIRDNHGAVRIFDPGNVPLPPEVREAHRERIEARARFEGRPASFQMVVDDIYAISKGYLVGRNRR